MKQPSWILVSLLLGSFAVAADDPDKEQLSRITGSLMCTCGCPHIIRQCGDECGMAPQLIHKIEEHLGDGKTEEEIYSIFEDEYGPSVHAVPDTEGFNLLAWVTPFVGLLIGLFLVVVVVKNLKPKSEIEEDQPSSSEIETKYRRMLDKELER